MDYKTTLENLGKNIFITAECVDCGQQSTIKFGFASPCPLSPHYGRHRKIIDVPSSRKNEHAKLRATYAACPSFDRIRFDKEAPDILKKFLREG